MAVNVLKAQHMCQPYKKNLVLNYSSILGGKPLRKGHFKQGLSTIYRVHKHNVKFLSPLP